MSDLTLSTDDGTVTIPLAMLSDPTVRAALAAAFRTADRAASLAEIWAMVDAMVDGEYPGLNVDSCEIEWCSEYDDEGGYYWALAYASLLDADGTPIDNDEVLESFRDGLYEVNMDRESMPDGTYNRLTGLVATR